MAKKNKEGGPVFDTGAQERTSKGGPAAATKYAGRSITLLTDDNRNGYFLLFQRRATKKEITELRRRPENTIEGLTCKIRLKGKATIQTWIPLGKATLQAFELTLDNLRQVEAKEAVTFLQS